MKKDPKKTKKNRIKKRRLVTAVLGIAATIFIADGVRRSVSTRSTSGSLDDKDFFGKADLIDGEAEPATVGFDKEDHAPERITGSEKPGYKKSKLTSSELSNGALTIISDAHPVSGDIKKASQVYLESFGNGTFTVADDSIMLSKEAAVALNKMMSDYEKATGLTDFVVYGTDSTYTVSGPCAREIPERVTGDTVDFALSGYLGIIGYDGRDEEGWVVQNCAKYGFIVRYPEGKSQITGQKYCPWHLRYVGEVHAELMAQNDLCLEEYVDFLKDYTVDEPLTQKLGNRTYEIYTYSALGDFTEVLVPSRGNYESSGDNIGTFVITVTK